MAKRQKPKATRKQAGKTGALVRKGLPKSVARKIAQGRRRG